MDVTEIEAHKAASVLLAFEQSYATISLILSLLLLTLFIYIAYKEFVKVDTVYIDRSHLREQLKMVEIMAKSHLITAPIQPICSFERKPVKKVYSWQNCTYSFIFFLFFFFNVATKYLHRCNILYCSCKRCNLSRRLYHWPTNNSKFNLHTCKFHFKLISS